MSAYLCNPKHIGLLAAYLAVDQYASHGPAREYARGVAKTLALENIRSVANRYPDDVSGGRPGVSLHDSDYVAVSQQWASHYADKRRAVSPVTILKLVQCLEYQSCETEDWDTTHAAGNLRYIRDVATRKLPGYEDCPWEWEDTNVPEQIEAFYQALEVAE